MRTRVLFTVLTLAVAGILGAGLGFLLNDFGVAYVLSAVIALGVLVIGILEWDHGAAESPAATPVAVEDSADFQPAAARATLQSVA